MGSGWGEGWVADGVRGGEGMGEWVGKEWGEGRGRNGVRGGEMG